MDHRVLWSGKLATGARRPEYFFADIVEADGKLRILRTVGVSRVEVFPAQINPESLVKAIADLSRKIEALTKRDGAASTQIG